MQNHKSSAAGFWIRALAAILDALVFGQSGKIVCGIVNRQVDEFTWRSYFLGLGITMVAGYLICAGLESSGWQGTIGKKILGLVVTDSEGRRITFLRAFGRQLAKILSAIPLGAGYLLVAVQPDKQGLHDLVVKTYVRKTLPLRRVLIAGVIGLIGLGVFYYAVGKLPIAEEGNQAVMEFVAKFESRFRR